MNLEQALSFLHETEKAEAAYNHASGLIYYDGVTQAPRSSAQNRSETLAFLSGESYKLSTSPALFDAVCYLNDHIDPAYYVKYLKDKYSLLYGFAE